MLQRNHFISKATETLEPSLYTDRERDFSGCKFGRPVADCRDGPGERSPVTRTGARMMGLKRIG